MPQPMPVYTPQQPVHVPQVPVQPVPAVHFSAPLPALPTMPEPSPVASYVAKTATVRLTTESVPAPVMEVEGTRVSPAPPVERLLSIDAYRGVTMLLMASGGLGLAQVAKSFPDTPLSKVVPFLQHVTWTGWTPWDLIQPSFMFLVGVSMPFSHDRRIERGGSSWGLFFHAIWRSLLLVALGVLCASQSKTGTNWVFTNVLAQIGLGYTFLFLLWRLGTWGQVLGTLGILGGYWAWFAYSPALPVHAQTPSADVLGGFFAHWNMHVNPAAKFDTWFLNLFPRTEAFVLNEGGYTTLNFVPSIATMCLGLMAGRWLRTKRSHVAKVQGLIIGGAVLLALGWSAAEYACPLVKRIWTPSWVLFSGSIVTLLLAGFYCVVELMRGRWLAWPYAVVGMNSIFVYLATQLSTGWIKGTMKQHLGPTIFDGVYGPMIERGSVLALLWLACWWLYRQRAFIRI
jgi:predicted acyltransferase